MRFFKIAIFKREEKLDPLNSSFPSIDLVYVVTTVLGKVI